MKKFKKILFEASVPYGFVFFILLLQIGRTQIPITQITAFGILPTGVQVMGISFGPPNSTSKHCYFWLNSPIPGQIQIACYSANSPIPDIKNEIHTVPQIGFQGFEEFPDGTMTWLIQPNSFHLAGVSTDGMEVHKDGTY